MTLIHKSVKPWKLWSVQAEGIQDQLCLDNDLARCFQIIIKLTTLPSVKITGEQRNGLAEKQNYYAPWKLV